MKQAMRMLPPLLKRKFEQSTHASRSGGTSNTFVFGSGHSKSRAFSAANTLLMASKRKANGQVKVAERNKDTSEMVDDTDPSPTHSSSSGPRSRIVWVDMEMTGLNAQQHRIVEVACLITDGDLRVIAEAPTLVIYQPTSVLDNMSDWCRVNFAKSGLTEQIRNSQIDLQQADQQLLEFVKTHCEPKTAPLAGSSVYCDRMFMKQQLPLLDEYLHYRIIDVSTIKELCKRWYPREFSHAPKKVLLHRAQSDILESIEELRYYRDSIFKSKSSISEKT